MKKFQRFGCLLLALCLLLTGMPFLSGCGSSGGTDSGGTGSGTGNSGGVTEIGSGKSVIRILSGSENKELEPILEEYADKNHVKLEMTYKGSIDIMRALQDDEIPYDAVWPASSLWISMGDVSHKVKHAESVSITPVVFGIRRSLAEELGFVGKEVSVKDILEAIRSGRLSFCMTSATQSNSGCCAYIGFLYALLGNPEVITSEDLQNQEVQAEMKELLSGVDRSSGSSDWLKEMFLAGDYDAMVNYECLIIAANQELTADGKEPLYVVYPYDGLSIADSPLGYVDNGDEKEEELFLDFQQYLLSEDVQNEIQRTGRRTGYTGVSEENKDVFNADWGVQADRVLSPIKMPESDVLQECLNLYQSELKKPSLTVYCLDYSGSMAGDGHSQLIEAMSQILQQDNAKANYLQASPDEVNILIPFNSGPIQVLSAEGNGSEIEDLYTQIEQQEVGGGTNMYRAAERGLEELKNYDLSKYQTAMVLMTDGQSVDDSRDFEETYDEFGKDIPVFSIMFGDADESQLKEVAEYTNARVFDGRDSLAEAFRAVRGYN